MSSARTLNAEKDGKKFLIRIFIYCFSVVRQWTNAVIFDGAVCVFLSRKTLLFVVKVLQQGGSF